VDAPDAQHAGKRRPNRLPVDGRVDFANSRLRLALVRRRLVELGARHDPLVEQALDALEVHARQIALRFGRGQLRPLLPRVPPARVPRRGTRPPPYALPPESNPPRSTPPARPPPPAPPRPAAAVPMAVNVDGHSSRAATIVVTASGGGW